VVWYCCGQNLAYLGGVRSRREGHEHPRHPALLAELPQFLQGVDLLSSLSGDEELKHDRSTGVRYAEAQRRTGQAQVGGGTRKARGYGCENVGTLAWRERMWQSLSLGKWRWYQIDSHAQKAAAPERFRAFYGALALPTSYAHAVCAPYAGHAGVVDCCAPAATTIWDGQRVRVA